MVQAEDPLQQPAWRFSPHQLTCSSSSHALDVVCGYYTSASGGQSTPESQYTVDSQGQTLLQFKVESFSWFGCFDFKMLCENRPWSSGDFSSGAFVAGLWLNFMQSVGRV